MRRGVAFLVSVVVAAGLGAASAGASGTTTTTGTTTAGTTTATTTSTTTPAYARLTPSYLSAGCVGAGATAIAVPGRPVLTLGTPASDRGPSAYPASTGVVAFDSSTASGSTCNTASVALQAVSLLGGVVTAASVEATHGRGTVAGLAIQGTPTALAGGETVAVGNWGLLTLGKRVGRLAAPLVLVLRAPHGSLPAGTVIAVAFTASAQPVKSKHSSSPSARDGSSAGGNTGTTQQASGQAKQQRHRKQHKPLPAKPPPDFPASASPFAAGGKFTDAVQDNPVVSTALQYLGVPYQWGGASPTTGFDCSGLVQYVFAQLGVPLVHYAAAQYRAPNGVWVPPDRLQPGDLVFFVGSDGTRKEPGHVGIYVDDGYIIDAPHTGTFVRIDSLDERNLADQYVGARRIDSRLIDARHLLHATKPEASTNALLPLLPSPFTLTPLGESLGIASAATAAAPTTTREYWIWAGVALGGLLLLLSAGGVVVRRRRHPPDSSPS